MSDISSDDEYAGDRKLIEKKHNKNKLKCAGPGENLSSGDLQIRRTVEIYVLDRLVQYFKKNIIFRFTVNITDIQMIVSFHMDITTPIEVFIDFETKSQNISVYTEYPRGRKITKKEVLNLSTDSKNTSLNTTWNLVVYKLSTLPTEPNTMVDKTMFAVHDAIYQLMDHKSFADIGFNTKPTCATDSNGIRIGYYIDVICFTNTHRFSSGIKFLCNLHNNTVTPTVWCGMWGKELPCITYDEIYKLSIVNKLVRVFYQYLKIVKSEVEFERMKRT